MFITAAQVEAWLEGLLLQLAAGHLKNALLPSPSGVLCCRLFLTFAEDKTGMEISGSTPTAFRQAGRPARRERNRRRTSCCGGTPLLLDCITLHSRGGRPVPSSRFCAAAQAGHSDPESHRDDERWTFALFRGKSDGPQPARPTPGGSAGRRGVVRGKTPAPRSASLPSRRTGQPASCLTPGRPPAATRVKERRAR